MAFRPPGLPLIPELLVNIAEHLHDDKGTLAKLARTCRAFENPALDVLWSFLENADPLIECLPTHLREVTDSDYCEGIMLHLETLSANDCERMLQYARRVRRFKFSLARGNWQQVRCFVFFQRLHTVLPQGEGVLFPSLRALECEGNENDYQHLPFLDMLLGPYLKKISFRCSSGGIITSYVIVSKLKSRRLIKSLELFWREEEKGSTKIELVSEISSMIPEWQNLETLQITNLSNSALLVLSHSPKLKSLGIYTYNPDHFGELMGAGSGGFPVLCDLFIDLHRDTTTAYFIPVLELLNSSPLQGLTLISSRHEYGAPTLWRRIFVAINKGCRHNSLVSLIIFNPSDYSLRPLQREEGDEFSFEAIAPLLDFHDLLSIHIDVPKGLDEHFNSSAAVQMASNWKKLKSLKFIVPPYCQTDRPPNMTLQDLIPFAEMCPNLEELGLLFSVEHVSTPAFLQKPGNGVFQTALKKLFVGDSGLRHFKWEIPVFLSSLFPALNEIIFSRESDPEWEWDDDMNSWSEVAMNLRVCHAIRQQERYQYLSETYVDVPADNKLSLI